MERVDALVAVVRRASARRTDRTPGQVALAWCVAKGTVPIPGAKHRAQAEENAGALGWALAADEVAALDAAALYGTRTISSSASGSTADRRGALSCGRA